MIGRKRNILLIQLTIFFVAVALLYNTYLNKNKKKETFVQIESETNPDVNSFTDIEYSGFDLTGNRYVLKAGKADYGYNARTEKFEDLVKAGVVDPTKVTRIAIENAASIAAMLLTTECVIADQPEEASAAGMPPMGGGMPGMM